MTEYGTQFRQDNRAEPLSPELALVDPELARVARALLPDQPATVATSNAREAAPQGGDQPNAALDSTDVSTRTEPSLRQRLLDAGADPKLLEPPAPREDVDESRTLAEQHPRSRRRSWRRRLVALTVLALVGAAVAFLAVAFLAFDRQPDRLTVISHDSGTGAGRLDRPPAVEEARRGSTPTTDAATPGQVTQQPRQGQARQRSASSRRAAARPRTARIAATTRTFVWPPVPRARFYRVEFFSRGRTIFQASPTKPRLTLPLAWRYRARRFRLTRGTYQWRVRPAFSPTRLGAPIMRSTWVVR